MTTSGKSGTSNQNNDDIYLNMGNVDLKLPVKKQNSSNDQESTKVEAESDRGTSKQRKTRKVKKVKITEPIDGGD
jgi:hypothetical protein